MSRRRSSRGLGGNRLLVGRRRFRLGRGRRSLMLGKGTWDRSGSLVGWQGVI